MGKKDEGPIQQDYKHFFDDSPVPMIIYDPIGLVILAVNTAAIANYGYSKEEFLAKTLLDIRPAEDKAPLITKVAELENEEFNDAGHWRHIKKDGTVFYVHVFSNRTTFNGKIARLSLVYDIDKRIVTEQENAKLNNIIKAQKDQLDDILSSIKEVIWSRSISDGRLTYINDASIDIFGYTPEEMTAEGGMHLEHVHPDDRAELENKIRQNYRDGSAELEYRIIHKDGSTKYLLTQANVKRNEKGEPLSYNGVTIDVTHLRRVENALKKKVEEIENVFESITDSFISINKEWEITYANRHFEALVGKKREELLGKNMWATFPKLVDSLYYKDYMTAMNDRKVAHSEGTSPTTGDTLSVYFYPTDAGIAVYFKDITEQSNLATEIANKQKKLNAIINNTMDIIWSIDMEGKVISANDAYYKRLQLLTGKQNIDEIGENDYGEDRIEKWRGYFARVLGGETFKVTEEDIVEGKVVYEEISFNPIYDKDNRIAGASCFSRNITDHVEQLKMIQEQNEKLKNIAWIQSHKVRGPVATILGLVGLLNDDDPVGESNKEIIEGVKSATLQLDNVIREVVHNTII